jgi:import inner membrane translocase subunit TIM44
VKGSFKAVGDGYDAVSSTVGKVAKPVLDTKAAKFVGSGVNSVKKDIVDTTTSHRYIEYQPKEAREKARAEKMDPIKRQIFIANPEAGENIVLHKDEKLKDSWSKFKDNSSIFKGIRDCLLIIPAGLLDAKKSIDESSSQYLSIVRWFADSTPRVESEEALVVRAFRQVDPKFTIDGFMRDAAEFYIPDVMDAIISGDLKVLKEWCSESVWVCQIN